MPRHALTIGFVATSAADSSGSITLSKAVRAASNTALPRRSSVSSSTEVSSSRTIARRLPGV